MVKNIFNITALMIAVNGFWYCATYQKSIGETPLILIPSIATIVLVLWLAFFVIDNWDE